MWQRFFLLYCFLMGTCIVWANPNKLILVSAKGGAEQGELTVQAILTEAYHQLDMQIEVLSLPPKRAGRMAHSGQVDGFLMRPPFPRPPQNQENNPAPRASASDSNAGRARLVPPDLIQIPVVLTQSELVVFSKKYDFPLQEWESLSSYFIGVRGGFREIENSVRDISHVSVNSDEQLFRMLDAGKVDLIVVEKLVGLSIVQRLPLQGIRQLSPPLVKSSFYHFLHRKHRALIPQITEVLEQMKAKGRFEQIHNGLMN